MQDLSLQQLRSVKKQLDEEVEHLSVSYSKLRSAQTKFRDCIRSIEKGVTSEMAGLLLWDRELKIKLTIFSREVSFNPFDDVSLHTWISCGLGASHCGCWNGILRGKGKGVPQALVNLLTQTSQPRTPPYFMTRRLPMLERTLRIWSKSYREKRQIFGSLRMVRGPLLWSKTLPNSNEVLRQKVIESNSETASRPAAWFQFGYTPICFIPSKG